MHLRYLSTGISSQRTLKPTLKLSNMPLSFGRKTIIDEQTPTMAVAVAVLSEPYRQAYNVEGHTLKPREKDQKNHKDGPPRCDDCPSQKHFAKQCDQPQLDQHMYTSNGSRKMMALCWHQDTCQQGADKCRHIHLELPTNQEMEKQHVHHDADSDDDTDLREAVIKRLS